MITISFYYKNHRGSIEERTIDVESLDWLSAPDYDYQPGWFITGRCHDRDAIRSFALTHIILPVGTHECLGFKLLKVPQ